MRFSGRLLGLPFGRPAGHSVSSVRLHLQQPVGLQRIILRSGESVQAVLPSLTEEHLKQLGVTALGHRVKLLDAIAALRNAK